MSTGLTRAAAHRIVSAVVREEVRRLRSADQIDLPGGEWPDATAIGNEGLGLDSLEQLGALGALAEMFELDGSLLDDAPPRTVGAWVDLVLHPKVAGNRQIVVNSSGSTGLPRPCIHVAEDLLDEADFLATQFIGRRRVIALVPAHHLYGIIWTALLPAALGVPVVALSIGGALGLAAGDLVVAVPEQWRALARMLRRIPEDVIGISSAGPLDPDVGTSLLKAGLARLVDVYGASETGGIAMRDVPAIAYDLLPRWRLFADGDDWQLTDRSGKLYELPDHVELVGDHRLRPVGRRDGAVQVGGHNVWPERVVRKLRAIDGVEDAAVRLHTNGRLKAFIVPDQNCETSVLSARIERASELDDVERPKKLCFGPALPRNAMGKLEDWA